MMSYQNNQDIAHDGEDGSVGEVDGQNSHNNTEDAMDMSVPASSDDPGGNLPSESKLEEEENSLDNGTAEMEVGNEENGKLPESKSNEGGRTE